MNNVQRVDWLIARGDVETAERLAWVTGMKLSHHLIANTEQAIDADTERKVDVAVQAASDASYSQGFDDGKRDGENDAQSTAVEIATRHYYALGGSEAVIVHALQAYAKADPKRVEAVDRALLAFGLVLEEIDDYSNTFGKDQS